MVQEFKKKKGFFLEEINFNPDRFFDFNYKFLVENIFFYILK